MSSLFNRSLAIGAVAIVFAALAYGGVSAEEKKAESKPAACKSMKAEADCTGRDDCSWVQASVDKKTGKEKRKAYCRTKPKSKK